MASPSGDRWSACAINPPERARCYSSSWTRSRCANSPKPYGICSAGATARPRAPCQGYTSCSPSKTNLRRPQERPDGPDQSAALPLLPLLNLSQGYLSRLREGDGVPGAPLVSLLALLAKHAQLITEQEDYWTMPPDL